MKTIKLKNKDLFPLQQHLASIEGRGYRLSANTLLALAEVENQIDEKFDDFNKIKDQIFKDHAHKAEKDSEKMVPDPNDKKGLNMVPEHKKDQLIIDNYSDKWYEWQNKLEELFDAEVEIKPTRTIKLDDLHFDMYKDVGGKEVKEKHCVFGNTYILKKLGPMFK
jgi:hypothetical protein